MSYYPELESHIRNKIKIELELSNYTTKKEGDHATGIHTYDLDDLAPKRILLL